MSDVAPLAHPEWLVPLASLVAGCALAMLFAFRRGERALRGLIGVAPGSLDRGLRDGLLLLALAAVAVGLVGPRIGTEKLRVPATGLDLVVLLDLSRSMTAADVPPSRMARARRIAAGVLERLGEGDRAALAVFAGQAALVTPITPDKAALTEMLPALDPTLLADVGSDGAAGLQAALPAFEGSGPRPRLLLLLSDGEVGRVPASVLEDLKRADTRVVTVLLGTEPGGPIPDRGRLLLDADGRTVRSRRVLADLAPVVEATGGRSFLADAWGEVDLRGLVAEIRRDAIPTAEGMLLRRVPVTWVALPAGAALLLLLLEAWPRAFGRRRRPTPSPPPAIPGTRTALVTRVLPWLLLGVLVPRAAEPQADPRPLLEARLRADGPDGRLLVALGVARAEAGEQAEARQAFRAAALGASDPRVSALAWYDLGVLALEGGRLAEARDAFFESLALEPGSRKAKFNLEWTLAALRSEEREPPEAPPRPDPSAQEEAPQPDEDAPATEPEQQRAEERAEPTPDEPPAEGQEARSGRSEPPPPLDREAAERWLDGLEDDVRAALEAQLEELGGPWRGGPRW